MKKAYIQDSKRMFKNNFSRFVSIVVIILLGSMFFIGMNSVAPVMKETAQNYMQEKNVYDFSLSSIFGYTVDDVDKVKQNEHIVDSCGVYFYDVLTKFNESDIVIRLSSLMDNTDMNQNEIIEGRNISSDNECLISSRLHEMYNYNVGDKISFYLNDDTNLNDYLNCMEYTIVGITKNPIYLSKLYGNTTLLSGELHSYVFIKASMFKLENYSLIYVKTDIDNSINKFSSEYKDKIISLSSELEKINNEIADSKYQDFYNSSVEKIDNYKEQIEFAKQYFTSQKQEINNIQLQANSAIVELSYYIGNAYKYSGLYDRVFEKNSELDSLYNQLNLLNEKKDSLSKSCAETTIQIESIEKKLKELDSTINQSLYAIYSLEDNDNEFVSLSKNVARDSFDYNSKNEVYNNLCNTYNTQKEELNNLIIELQHIEDEITSKQSEINNTFSSLKDLTYGTKNNTFIKKAEIISEYQNQIQASRNELNDLILKVNLDEHEKKLYDMQSSLSKFNAITEETPLYENSGFKSLKDDLDKIAIMGRIFPVMFFVVAALVTITTITRMIEEDRKNLGTFKALGYSKRTIISRYILYSLLAAILGTILGTVLGSTLIVNILFTSYSSLYDLPNANFSINWLLAMLSLIISLSSTVLITVIVTLKELNENTAQLMRPKAAKEGKNIFLEKMPFLWKRFSFLTKISFRNIFRYKRRLFMTIIGIAGCTALIYSGLSLQSSIKVIASRQFSNVRKLSMELYLKQELNENDISEVLEFIDSQNYIKEYLPVCQNSLTVKFNDNSKDVYFIAGNSNTFTNYIDLHERNQDTNLELNDSGVIITEKLANILQVKKGDSIRLINESQVLTVEIIGITENYLYNYVYFTPAIYEKFYGTEITYNSIFINLTQDLSSDEEISLSNKLKENDNISSTIFEHVLHSEFKTSLGSLTTIVLLFIGCASLLSITVLINLNNINIEERQRELATIKLLGFRKKELESYVFKENIILTIIGILCGLLLGICIFGVIIQSAEVETIFLPKDINYINLIISSLITIIFTLVTNLFMKKKIKKINMIDSLKYIE